MQGKKFVSPLNKREKDSLDTLRKNSNKNRVRTRSHAILLSAEGASVNEIAQIYKVKRDTVSSWLNSWEKKRIEGLHDLPRIGGPCKLTDNEKQIAIKCIKDTPNSPKMALAKTIKITGKTISIDTLKRIAKDARLSWKRVKKSVKSKRDEKAFKKGKERYSKAPETA